MNRNRYMLASLLLVGLVEALYLFRGVRQQNRIRDRIETLRADTRQLQTKCATLGACLAPLPRQLSQQTLLMSNPIIWCYDWSQRIVAPHGTGYDVAYQGLRTPFRLQIPKSQRDQGCYRNIVFTPYQMDLHLSASATALRQLAEAIEQPDSAAIITSLFMKKTMEAQQATAQYQTRLCILFPAFRYAQEQIAIEQALDASNPKPTS